MAKTTKIPQAPTKRIAHDSGGGAGGGTADASAAVKKKTADGPRAPKAAGRAAAHEARASADKRYSDPSTVGWFDESEALKSAHGKPGPRGPEHELDGKHDRVQPGELLPSGVPAPLE
jgi:hypothetical protein